MGDGMAKAYLGSHGFRGFDFGEHEVTIRIQNGGFHQGTRSGQSC